jgi:hypothetical protein
MFLEDFRILINLDIDVENSFELIGFFFPIKFLFYSVQLYIER